MEFKPNPFISEGLLVFIGGCSPRLPLRRSWCRPRLPETRSGRWEAVLRPMGIAENIKVVSATENSDIFSAQFEPINFIVGRGNRLIVQALKTTPFLWEKNSYFGLVVRSNAASSTSLNRLPGFQYLGANFDVDLLGGRYPDVLNSYMNIERLALGNVHSFLGLRSTQVNLHPGSLLDTLRGELVIQNLGLIIAGPSQNSREDREQPVSRTTSFKEFTKEHKNLSINGSLVILAIGSLIAFFGGDYYLNVERNIVRFVLCVCIGALAFAFLAFIAHLIYD